jgi:energy-coupling factor transporter ATP-binding protein EcfA2
MSFATLDAKLESGLLDKRLTTLPTAPNAPEDLDIPKSLAEDLMLRRLYTKGKSSIRELSETLKLSFPLLYSLFQDLRQQQLFEVTGMEGNDYVFTLSGTGRELAAKRFLISHYSGPAPVSVTSYNRVVRSQAAIPIINRSLLATALSDLVLTTRFLDELGPALASQKSIFLYGPTGNGKTSVVRRLSGIYRDVVAIPYAVEVDGQVVVVYDPAIHEKVDAYKEILDPRWVLCRRPCIVVGGELETNMLELQLEDSTRIYVAPVQMRANNGILVIDDFGRQLVSPQYLLNRWIVPLDRRVDYLTLKYGLKFQIPFEMTVIFATNLDPADLADEAFLRRIRNKIYVDHVDNKIFDKIFDRVVAERKLPCEPHSAENLRKLCLQLGGKELRACHPSDILDILVSISAYEAQPPKINPDNLKRAARLYFAKTKKTKE